MRRKLFVGAAPVLAVVALGLGPALAQAEPHWYANGAKITEGESVPVAVAGAVTFMIKEEAKESLIKCKITGKSNVVNPTGGGAGTDEVTEAVFSGCGPLKKLSPCAAKTEAVTIVSTVLPWASTLGPGPGKWILDNITVGGLEVKCAGTTKYTLAGKLDPKVAATSVLQEGLPNPGELSSGATIKGTVKGAQLLTGPTGKEKITAKNP